MSATEARSGHRRIHLPGLLRLVDGAAAAAAALADAPLGRAGSARRFLVIHTGARSLTGYGRTFAAAAARLGLDVRELAIADPDGSTVSLAEAAIRREGPTHVVGVGGGRIVDIAKLAAAHADVAFVSVPTQASSDGLCSPVAVVVDEEGRPASIGARIPTGVIVDMQVLATAPRATWLAGLGDLVSNLSAVRDWRWAHAARGEAVDDFACLTAEAAALSVLEATPSLEDVEYREKLVRGLILSGVAMEMAGSSRPASGSEHLISHALDRTASRPRPHGLQVALATIAAFILRGEDPTPLVAFYAAVGLPATPAELGFDVEDIVRAARVGPSTRPGRATILDEFNELAADRLRRAFDVRAPYVAVP